MPRITEDDVNEMTTMVFGAMSTTLAILSSEARFTNSAVMSAAIYVLVDAGMRAVEGGVLSREQLADQACSAARSAIKDFSADGERGTLQ